MFLSEGGASEKKAKHRLEKNKLSFRGKLNNCLNVNPISHYCKRKLEVSLAGKSCATKVNVSTSEPGYLPQTNMEPKGGPLLEANGRQVFQVLDGSGSFGRRPASWQVAEDILRHVGLGTKRGWDSGTRHSGASSRSACRLIFAGAWLEGQQSMTKSFKQYIISPVLRPNRQEAFFKLLGIFQGAPLQPPPNWLRRSFQFTLQNNQGFQSPSHDNKVWWVS